MNEKILTVSIPAYNIEKTIDKLLLSLLQCKEMDKLEILIVNDGSKDETKNIGLKYEKEYPNIVKFIDKENGGHGSTINRGISLATGKYFKSIDGDDWVYTKDLDSIIDILSSSNSDIVLTNYFKVFPEKYEKVTYNNLIPLKKYSVDSFFNFGALITYHSVIFKTSILKNKIHIDEQRFYVDTEYCLFPLKYANSVLYVNKYMYCYWLGRQGQSVSMEGRIRHLNDGVYVSKKLIKFFNNNSQDFSAGERKYFLNNLVNHCSWVFDTMLSKKASLRNLHDLDEYVDYLKKETPIVSDLMSKKKRSYFVFSSFKYSYWFLKLVKG